MTASLRERLREKKRRSTTYPLAVADTSEAEYAAEQARQEYRRAALTYGDEGHAEVKKAKKALDKAERVESDCYEYVTVRALPAPDFEALVDAHPPHKGEEDTVSWHTETFRPALLAACVDSDMTEDDWSQFFAESGSYGDQAGIYTVALNINTRTPAPAVGKGSTGSPS